jgi:hypothetical protein
VSEDFGVVAVIAPQVVTLVRPPLTTVELPAFEMGQIGAEILIRHLADGDLPPAQLRLRGQLHVRSGDPAGPCHVGRPRRPASLLHNPCQRPLLEPSWEPFGMD